MDYREMAGELLRLRSEQFKSGVWRQTAKLAQGEHLALYYLQSHNGETYPRQLSDELSVSTARTAAMLRDMEEKGWVIRRDDPSDNRHILVTLTGDGREEMSRRREQTLSALAGALEALGPEDSAELIRILKRMNEICNDRK